MRHGRSVDHDIHTDLTPGHLDDTLLSRLRLDTSYLTICKSHPFFVVLDMKRRKKKKIEVSDHILVLNFQSPE